MYKVYGYTAAWIFIVFLGISGYVDHGVSDALKLYYGYFWQKSIYPWHTLLYTYPKILTELSIAWWIVCLVGKRSLDWHYRCAYYGRAIVFSLTLIGLVVLLKWATRTSCPWDNIRYGGSVVSHSWLWHGWEPYECFPAGHATSGFALLGWLYMPRRINNKKIFMTVIVWGIVLGCYQMLRGAHYLTHTLTTLWLACLLWEVCARVPIWTGKKTSVVIR